MRADFEGSHRSDDCTESGRRSRIGREMSRTNTLHFPLGSAVIGSMACSAAVGLGRWDDIAQYEKFLSNDIADSYLYRALLQKYKYFIYSFMYCYFFNLLFVFAKLPVTFCILIAEPYLIYSFMYFYFFYLLLYLPCCILIEEPYFIYLFIYVFLFFLFAFIFWLYSPCCP